MSIEGNILSITSKIKNIAIGAGRDPDGISLMAVSKNVGPKEIHEAFDAGIKDMGESRVQEMLKKHKEIKEDIKWHFIGPLQTNKVKYIINKVDLIHSLDRISLAKEINKRARLVDKTVNVLIQVNISREATKSGLLEEDLIPFIHDLGAYSNICVKGLMGIGPNTVDTDHIRGCFRRLNHCFMDIRDKAFDNINMKYLSMGMSNDYAIAIEEGANILRIGRAIFFNV